MTRIADAIFAIPPFPGAASHPVAHRIAPGESRPPSGVTPAALIAALRQHKVGGPFWRTEQPGTNGQAIAANDPRALIAALALKPVTTIGSGAYEGLSGLPVGEPQTEALLEMLVERDLLSGISYHNPYTGEAIDPLQLAAIFGGWHRHIETNRPIAAAFGFARWKQDTVQSLLWGGHPVPFLPAREHVLARLPEQCSIAVWKARVPPAFLARLESGPWRLVEIEDGFIRSAGLGADCVPPLSIVFDDLGVHYDPSRTNRLEQLLIDGAFSDDDLSRARLLRDWIVREGVSKYGIGAGAAIARGGDGLKHVLAVGQVEDDRSVQFGGGAVKSNLELLKRARALNPGAHITYRPHPDVEAGHRNGAIPARTALEFADAIDAKSPISALIDSADEVHVITSLAGFEALMRGKAAITHGTPFYAGWGLTQDLAPPHPRRQISRTLDELVAATLLRYPLYLDPVTNLPCSAEIVVMRLLTGNRRRNGALVPLRQFFGWMKRATAQLLDLR